MPSSVTDSPAYRLAEADTDFLGLSELRGVRLQLEYTKAQMQLESHGVAGTIVVFGSTRIVEPQAARNAVQQLQQRLAQVPAAEAAARGELERRLAVAERIAAKSHYYDVARRFGRLASESLGVGATPWVVMTGGGPGVMEAANRGAGDAGAHSVGLNILLPQEQVPNPYVTPGLCLRFHYFALRKMHFMMRARALVAFPGGYGTMDELFETLTLIQTRKIEPVPVVLVGQAYWKRAFDADFLVDEGVIGEQDRELFWFAETAEEILEGIIGWYRRRGLPLPARSST